MHAAVNANCLADQSGMPTGGLWITCILMGRVSGTTHDVQQASKTLDKLAREEGQRSKLDTAKLDVCLTKQDETVVRASMKQGTVWV